MTKTIKTSAKISRRNPWIAPILFSIYFLLGIGAAAIDGSLLTLAALTFVLFALYIYYWFYKTKQEINSLGADIPSFILIFIPIVNFFWFYKYAQGVVKFLKKGDGPVLWFFFTLFLMPIAAYFIQKKLNSYATLNKL